MNSDEKKIGAGWGGGPTDNEQVRHDDVRTVHGDFGRTADCVQFLVHPRDGSASFQYIKLGAAGDNGLIQLTSQATVLVETRQPGDPTGEIDDDLWNQYEIMVSATKGHGILIQRGLPDDPNRQTIIMQDGSIFINAGATGNLNLSAGSSSLIQVTPSHIRIHAETVDITGDQINLN